MQKQQKTSSAIADKPSDAGLVGFCDFYLPLSNLAPSIIIIIIIIIIKGIYIAQVRKGHKCANEGIRSGKTRTTGLQSGEGCTVIDSVVWAQYINVTDRQTDRQP